MLENFPQIKKFLDKVSSDLQLVLGKNLVSIYTWGSVTTGAFQEGLSDIDLVVIVENKINDNEFARLENWAKNLLKTEILAQIFDAVIVEKNAINFGTGNGSGGGIEFWKGKINWTDNCLGDNPIVLDNILKTGVTIYGVEPSEIINPVPREKILNAIKKELRELNDGMSKHFDTDLKFRYYVVCTLCRMDYTIENNAYTSKKEALGWYLNKYNLYTDIINKSLLFIKGDHESIRNTKKENYLDFIREVSEKI
jgi:predicted nucleotidyltransferase